MNQAGGNAESLQRARVSEHVAVSAARAVAGPALLRNMKISRQTQPTLNLIQRPAKLLAGVHVEHVRVALQRIRQNPCFQHVSTQCARETAGGRTFPRERTGKCQ
jgi:hypothetical protein